MHIDIIKGEDRYVVVTHNLANTSIENLQSKSKDVIMKRKYRRHVLITHRLNENSPAKATT